MGRHTVRKRCRDCRRTRQGTSGRLEWCDCGGELVELRYAAVKAKRRGR